MSHFGDGLPYLSRDNFPFSAASDPLLKSSKSGTNDLVRHRTVGFSGHIIRTQTAINGTVVVKRDIEDLPGEDHTEQNGQASYRTVGQLLIADVVGLGILTLPSAFQALGWVLAIVFLVLFLPLNLYTGLMLWEANSVWPAAFSFFDMGLYSHGKGFARLCGALVYSQIMLVLADYSLTIGMTLGYVFYDVQICQPIWGVIGMYGVVLPLSQVRTLANLKWLVYVNMLTLTAAIFICCIYLYLNGYDRPDGGPPEVVAASLSFQSFFGAFSKFAFAYAGQFLYLEMITEMKDSRNFPKALMIASPYQLTMYLLAGVTGYAYGGSSSTTFILDFLPFGTLRRVTAVLVFVHMAISYLVKACVLSRATHLCLAPSEVNNEGVKASAQWFAITLTLVTAAYIMAQAIPFFEELSGLIGSIEVPIICWIVPIMFLKRARDFAGKSISVVEYCIWTLIVVLALLVFGVGTYSNIVSLVSKFGDLGAPFSCQCQDVWQDAAACAAQ